MYTHLRASSYQVCSDFPQCNVYGDTKNPLFRPRIHSLQNSWCILTLFSMGEGAKRPPTSFSLVFPKELIPKLFWLLDLNFLSHWCKFSSLCLVPVQNYWTWTCTTPQKSVFLVKSLNNWGYENFSQRDARVTKPGPYDHIYNIIWIEW